jgi:hypothetical protein
MRAIERARLDREWLPIRGILGLRDLTYAFKERAESKCERWAKSVERQ